ncbi:hypothetical protein [Rhizobium subbaraonis]|uniref:hypothetical protein n=1 Tax=Rhizobium subbaraonis TaxID=908946 RepID=UPI0011438A09|nr:hypothetical protein [Rhizobium subbaraonis]
MTTPDGYDLEAGELVSAKLRAVFSAGLSVVRQDAPEEEIKVTVNQLVAASDEGKLVGAAILPASAIRALRDEKRWFCIFHTENDGKTHHGDVTATRRVAATKSAVAKLESDRRRELQRLLMSHLVMCDTSEELVAQLKKRWLGT